ncbi:MAG: DNA primase [Clostridia bacterium]|nr:DNA primase [Clostridia bacterium]
MIPREIIDEIVFRNDIEQVIGSYVNLRRAGSNYQGLCPFHSEKTPSFTVFAATKSFHCFGCGAGGDVISFIMRAENLTYIEAVHLLAERAGIDIPEDNSSQERETVSKKRILELNLAAAKFFRECLFDKNIGGEAMEYLAGKRQLNMATIKHFGLGYSPNDFTALTRKMRSLGFTDEELIAAFLAKRSQKSGKLFDLYRNRVIFPIIDTVGNIVAFGGRVMDGSEPKYLNTSDTPAFKKSRHLFALNYARKFAEQEMILCEGYMDVIALHEAGFENAVATLGTAITPDQARIFAKYTKKVIVCYDADRAGQMATSKAMRYLADAGVDCRIIKISGAKDPDEYVKKFGADSFRRVLGESRSGFDYRLEKILGEYNITLADEKIKAAEKICQMISDIPSSVERDICAQKAASALGLSFDSLKSDIARIRNRKLRDFKNKESRDAKLSIKNIGDRVNTDAAKHITASKSEEILLALMMIYDEYRQAAVRGAHGLSADDFSTAFGRRVFEVICELESSDGGYSRSMLGLYFNVDEVSRLEKIELERRQLSKNDNEVFAACIAKMKEEKQSVKDDGDEQLKYIRELFLKNKEQK